MRSRNVLLIIITYLFIFSPIQPAIGIGGIKFLYLLIPFIFSSRVKQGIKATKCFFIPYFVFFTYVFIRSFFADPDAEQLRYDAFTVLVEDFFIAHIIVALHDNYSVDISRSLRICLYIAVFSALLCLFFPPIKTFVDEYISLPNYIDEEVPDHRGFGIGLEKTYSYGISIAIIYIYTLFYDGPSIKKSLLFLLPFVAISIMINARTAIIVLLIGIIMYLIKEKKLIKARTIVFLFFIGVVLSKVNLSFLSNSSAGEFAMEFFSEIGGAIRGETKDGAGDTFTVLMNSFEYFTPQSIGEWVWGPGHIVGHDTLVVLDNGYFQEIYFGGLVYLIICFLIPVSFFVKNRNNHNVFFLFILLSCFILNFKGPFIPMAHAFKLISLLSLYLYLHPSFNQKETTRVQ